MMLHIRNMESSRCKTMVKNTLHMLGFRYKRVELGEVELMGNLSSEKLQLFDLALKNIGLELMNDKKKQYIEKIKGAIHQLINLPNDYPKPIFSEFISKIVNRDYTFLSNLF
jgi:hypothetical protein